MANMAQVNNVIAPDGTMSGDSNPSFRPAINSDQKYVQLDGKTVAGLNDRVRLYDNTGLVVNSVLTRREWDVLDAEVLEHPRLVRSAYNDLIGANLVKRLANAGVLMATFRVGGQRKEAQAFMDGEAAYNQGRTDRSWSSVPVPVIGEATRIGYRELMASRNGSGGDVSTHEVREATEAVVLKIEDMIFNGDAGIVVSGQTIYGFYTHPSRFTDTAANVGAGSWGTAGNAYKTVHGILSAMAALGYHGPFGMYVNPVDFHKMYARLADNTSDYTEIMRTFGPEGAGQLAFIKMNDKATAGTVAAVQMTPNVVDLAIAQDVENREWMSPNGRSYHGEVSAIMAPRLKADYSGNLGVAHITGIT